MGIVTLKIWPAMREERQGVAALTATAGRNRDRAGAEGTGWGGRREPTCPPSDVRDSTNAEAGMTYGCPAPSLGRVWPYLRPLLPEKQEKARNVRFPRRPLLILTRHGRTPAPGGCPQNHAWSPSPTSPSRHSRGPRIYSRQDSGPEGPGSSELGTAGDG